MGSPQIPLPPVGLGMFEVSQSYDVPVGTVIAFAGAIDGQTVTKKENGGIAGVGVTAPIGMCGWLPCDGKSYDPGEYPELYAALGYIYGKSGGSFHVPDLSGQFIRGLDDGKIDPDYSKRTRQTTGKPYSGESYSGVGSREPDAFQAHQHNYTPPIPASGGSGSSSASPGKPTTTEPPFSPQVGDDKARDSSETRPVNVYLNYLIKSTNRRIVPPTI